MDANENMLTLFTTRVRQMLLQYEDTRKENAELRAVISERDAKVKQLEELLAQASNDYDTLKMAKMIEITDGDLETAKKHLARLIRDVDRCATLLSGK